MSTFLPDYRKAIAKTAGPLAVPVMMTFSGTYLYPLQGISYFVTHPTLWSWFLAVLVPQLMLFIGMYLLFYIFLYPPQAALALFFNGPSGIVTAWIAILHESTVAAHLFAEATVLPTPLRGVFDSVLSREGFDSLVVKGRLRRVIRPTFFSRLKMSIKNAPRSIMFPAWVIQCSIKVALHFLPVFGPVLLVLMDGPKHARRCHRRYFELKGFDQNQEDQYVHDHRGQYLGFGMVSAALESLPAVGLFFAFTNTTAAALWAASSERRIMSANRQLAPRAVGAALNTGLTNVQPRSGPVSVRTKSSGSSVRSLNAAINTISSLATARVPKQSTFNRHSSVVTTSTNTRPSPLQPVIPVSALKGLRPS